MRRQFAYSWAPLAVGTVALLATIMPTEAMRAEDHFLTIGGGYSPTGNQVSLEKNVLLFRQLLADRYPQGTPHDIFFSDGDDPGRDLQFYDPDAEIPRPNLLVARVFRTTRHLGYRYRSHQVPGISGASSKPNLERWFNEVGAGLKQDDRLFVYVTAHGGKSRDRKAPQKTGLYLWNSQRLEMTDFAAMLKRLPKQVPVAVIMVQCYSGGFANLIFEDGDSKKGAAAGNRCGFFATVETRPAAGCTPDIHEENYREYSTYFWAAISGKSRLGEPVENCDYDGDGHVSLGEAHAYALLSSSTIDVPVSTSDAFLRAYSRTKGDVTYPAEATANQSSTLLTPDDPYDQLLQQASPAQKAVLESLSAQLQLKSSARANEARRQADRFAKEKRDADSQAKRRSTDLTNAAKPIRSAMLRRWPELNNRWDPGVDQILTEQGEELVRLIEGHSSYKRFEQLRMDYKALGVKKLDADRRWAKTQRLIRTLENVALANNLPLVANPTYVQRYQRLLEAEQQAFFGQ